MNVTIDCPPFQAAPDAKFTVTVAPSEHVTVFHQNGKAVITVKTVGAFFQFRKQIMEFQIPGLTNNRVEVPNEYVRPSDTARLAELLLAKEKPGSKAEGFLKEVADKEKRWGLSEGQENWLRSLSFKAFPSGKLPAEREPEKDARLSLDELPANIPF
jgi:hypothetical protein